ncbi:hypothetical protein Tco_0032665 [Tanacetum coccineum]
MQAASDRQKSYADLKRKRWCLEVGDIALLSRYRLGKGVPFSVDGLHFDEQASVCRGTDRDYRSWVKRIKATAVSHLVRFDGTPREVQSLHGQPPEKINSREIPTFVLKDGPSSSAAS